MDGVIDHLFILLHIVDGIPHNRQLSFNKLICYYFVLYSCMTVEEFIFLEEWQKAKLFAEGTYIGVRQERTFNIELHHVERFYVEEWHDFEIDECIGYCPHFFFKRFDLYWENVSLDDIEDLL
jgi:hypothetical protein